MSTSIPVPHISLHTAHTAIPSLLRSFPMPTPVGTQNLSAKPLRGTTISSSAATPELIAAAACGAMSANASLLKGRVIPSGFSVSKATLSPAARAVVSSLMDDEARRLSSIDAAALKAPKSEKKGSLNLSEPVPERSPSASAGGRGAADAARSTDSRLSMTLRPRSGSALPAEMRKAPDVAAVKKEEESRKSPQKKKRAVEKKHVTSRDEATLSKPVKQEPPSETPPSSQALFTPSVVLPKNFSIGDCIREHRVDPNALAALCNDVSGASQPFLGIPDDVMASYLLSLVTLAPEGGDNEQPTLLAPTGNRSDENTFTVALRTVACASCLAHRTMSTKWLSDDIIDGVLTNMQSMLKRVKKFALKMRSARQAIAEAEQNQKLEQASGRKKRERDGGANTAKGLPTELTRLLEAIRAMCKRLATMAADASRGIFSDVAILRVEEIAYSVVTLPYEDDATAEAVFDYIGRDALALIQLVWNRVEQGRERGLAALCDRVTAAPVILRRMFDVGRGVLVMPLSMVFVCVAQSWPLFLSEVTAQTVDAYHQQHATLVSCIITRIFAPSAEDDTDVRSRFVVQWIEDLCHLLGSPSFPVVDNILRLMLTGLAKAYLAPQPAQDDSAPSAHGEDGKEKDKDDAKLRVLVVDAIGRTSLQLHQQAGDVCTKPLDMSTAEEIPFLEEWQRIVCGSYQQRHAGATAGSIKRESKKAGKKGADGPKPPPAAPLRPLSIAERACCTIYTTLTERVGALSSDMALAARDFHTRRAFLFTWARSRLLPLQRDATADAWLDHLCRRMSNAQHSHVASDMEDETMAALATFVLTQQSRSSLHSDSRESLIALLLQAIKLQQHGTSWDLVRKKALSYASKLLELQPSLLRVTWPIAVQSFRDDAARVRESSVPLLQRILEASIKGMNASALSASEREEFRAVVGNVFAAFSMLLSDRSSTVLSKTLGALEDVLAPPPTMGGMQLAAMIATSEGELLLRYLQMKVCALLDHPDHGKRFHGDVVHLFASRWFVAQLQTPADHEEEAIADVAIAAKGAKQLQPSDLASSNKASLTIIKELTWLVCRFLPPPYEVDSATGNSGVHLLQELHRLSSSEGDAPKGPRKTRRWCEPLFVDQCMRHVVKRLIHSVMSVPPDVDDAGAALAALHAITIANPAWVEHMVEPISSLLTSYDPSMSPKEEDAVRFVQSSRILRTLLLHRTVATHVPLDRVTHTAGTLVAKYSGPLQQRVLVAAIGVLCSAVEVQPSSASCKQLKVWYQLVNGYYCRAASLLSQLKGGAGGNEVGYISRFAFLLSECLRSYHGWGKPAVAQLLSDASMLPAGTANRLATDRGGVAVSVQWFVQQCLECSEGARFMPLILRLIGSLCIADPSTFFRRNESIIQSALEARNDTQAQVQALLIVRDFLVDEDARVLRAAEQQAEKQRVKPAGPTSTLSKREPSTDDLNSGMATWVIQRFHPAVVNVATHSSTAIVRQLAMEIMDVALQQGLIPPAVLVEALITLSTDRVHPVNSERAQKALSTIAERHEDVIAPKCVGGIVKAFSFLQTSGLDVSGGGVLLGVLDATDIQPHTSVHDLLFRLISKHKKHRENLLVGLMRWLYQPTKAQEWIGQLNQTHQGSERDSVPPCGAFLQYVATTVALAPFTSETDVLLVLVQCAVAVDMHLQSWCDVVAKAATAGETKKPKGSKKSNVNNDTTASDVTAPALLAHEVMSCMGVLFCVALKRYLRKEFGISSAKLERYKGSGGAHIGSGNTLHVAKREARSHATAELFSHTSSLVRLCSDLLQQPCPAGAIQTLTKELEDATQDECAQMVLEGNTERTTERMNAKGSSRKASNDAKKKQKKKQAKLASKRLPRKRARGESEHSDTEGESSASSSSSSSSSSDSDY